MDSSKNGRTSRPGRRQARCQETFRATPKADDAQTSVPVLDNAERVGHMERGALLSMFSQSNETDEVPYALKGMLRDGLFLLWRGFVYASDLRMEPWQFPVESEALFRVGLSSIDLQWLIFKGFVEFEPNIASSADQIHLANRSNGFLEVKATRFVLTNSGATFVVRTYFNSLSSALQQTPFEESMEIGDGYTQFESQTKLCKRTPKWDAVQKELRVEDLVIKQFRWSAMNQEAVLMAFEEEEWPNRIDDPLSQKPGVDPKERLHDTVKCLNRNHRHRLIRFHGDGTGEGVVWTFLDSEAEIES